MKKDINFLRQQLEKDYKLEENKIKKRIKELEEEFDYLDDRLQNLDNIRYEELSKVLPLITIKNEEGQNYFYIYFRINNRKWSKSIKEGLELFLDFTKEDIEYITKNKNSICEKALKYIMNKEDYNYYLTVK